MSGPLFDWPFGDIPHSSYSMIVADPAWKFENYSSKGETKNPNSHYKCMDLEDIKILPVMDLAAKDCVLWLWATNPMLPQALSVMSSWGFEFRTAGTWVKMTKNAKASFGTGYIFRSSNEPILIGVRGDPSRYMPRDVRSVLYPDGLPSGDFTIYGLAREHSRKPEEAFDQAEHMMPTGKRIELFSRTNRAGWTSWGDEVGKLDGEAA